MLLYAHAAAGPEYEYPACLAVTVSVELYQYIAKRPIYSRCYDCLGTGDGRVEVIPRRRIHSFQPPGQLLV